MKSSNDSAHNAVRREAESGQLGSGTSRAGRCALPISENDAARRAPLLGFEELAAYRDFLFLLVWREVHLRYRHTLIGVGWTFLNPLLTMLVFGLIVPNLVSSETLAAQTQGVPYAVYVYCGLVPWTCFSHAVTRSNTCLIEQAPHVAVPLGRARALRYPCAFFVPRTYPHPRGQLLLRAEILCLGTHFGDHLQR